MPHVLYECPRCFSMLHVHPACTCRMSMLLDHAAFPCPSPCCFAMLHVLAVCSCYIHTACPCSTSLLHVVQFNAACCCLSMLPMHVACQCSIYVLHFHAVCPCRIPMSMLHVHADADIHADSGVKLHLHIS